jgi:hypothetical protein
MCLSLHAQDWDAIGDRLMDEIHNGYVTDVDGDDVRASGAGAFTALFVPSAIEAGGVPIAGMIGYDSALSSTHGDGTPWAAPSTPRPGSSAFADLWDSEIETSDAAMAGTVGNTGVTSFSSAYQGRPPSGGFPLLDVAGPNTYTWPEARADYDSEYAGLSPADKADVDAFWNDIGGSAEYAEVKDFLLNAAGSSAVAADHVIVTGPAGGMIQLDVQVSLSGAFGATASSTFGMSGAAAGFVVAGGAANATLEEGVFGAAGMWAHGTGLTEFGTEGSLTPADLTAVPGGYSINGVFVMSLMVPVDDPFVIGFGAATGAIAGADPNEAFVLADAYSDITLDIIGYSVPAGYQVELVPEPSSLALLALGVGGILIRRRKK